MTGKNIQSKRKLLDIEFMYLDLSMCTRCQGTETSLEEAISEVAQILEAPGVEVAVSKIHVQSKEQAAALGFAVSPTIRVNSRDIQMDWRESPCDSCGEFCGCVGEVSCREWEYQGQWYTIPPKGLIIDAILRKIYGGDEKVSEIRSQKSDVSANLKRFFEAKRKKETGIGQNKDSSLKDVTDCCSPSCCA